MSSRVIFSTPEQLVHLADILSKYARLPFSGASIPGAVLEGALAYIRGGKVLNTYDFVDVIKPSSSCGWQVKSTKEDTPVTWMRAKIPDRVTLIAASEETDVGTQTLGDTIINFCNAHVLESLRLYDLGEIGFSRLIVFANGSVTYYERLLCTRASPHIFNTADFEWRWSSPKRAVKKEQLPALHGFYRPTGQKWWAWHGKGENQLHFYGEKTWWPRPTDPHCITFPYPTEERRIKPERFIQLLERLDA